MSSLEWPGLDWGGAGRLLEGTTVRSGEGLRTSIAPIAKALLVVVCVSGKAMWMFFWVEDPQPNLAK